MKAKLANVPADVFDAHVAPHLSLADAARVAVASRSLRDMAAPGVRARVDRVVGELSQLEHQSQSTGVPSGWVQALGDGHVRTTVDARERQRIVTTWLATPTATVPILADVRGPGRVRVVKAYDPPPLRAHPLLRRAVRAYAAKFSGR